MHALPLRRQLRNGQALSQKATGKALNGNRNGDDVNVNPDWADNRNPNKGFRGLLMVFLSLFYLG